MLYPINYLSCSQSTTTRMSPRRCRLRPPRSSRMQPATRSSTCPRRPGPRSLPSAPATSSRLPSPTPASPPPFPRTGASRRLLFGVPLSSPPSTSPSRSRGRRAGTWSPAAPGLANGVAPGTLLRGGSSDKDERGGTASRR